MSEKEKVIYEDPRDLTQMSVADLKKYARGTQHEINKATRADEIADSSDVADLEEYLAEIKQRTGKGYDPQTDKDYDLES